MSGECGTFDYARQVAGKKRLSLICRGTGISVFVKIVDRWLKEAGTGAGGARELRVLDCNRSEDDILLASTIKQWSGQHGSQLAVHVMHVLSKDATDAPASSAAAEAAGKKGETAREQILNGRLSLEVTKGFLLADQKLGEGDGADQSPPAGVALVCGPPRFNAVAVKYLVQAGFTEDMLHVFA